MGCLSFTVTVDDRHKCRLAQVKSARQPIAEGRKASYTTRIGMTLSSFAALCTSVALCSIARATPLP